jgi:hypothetical protein
MVITVDLTYTQTSCQRRTGALSADIAKIPRKLVNYPEEDIIPEPARRDIRLTAAAQGVGAEADIKVFGYSSRVAVVAAWRSRTCKRPTSGVLR